VLFGFGYDLVMRTTLTGRRPRCRVCTHPECRDVESLLARGTSIPSIEPLMGAAFFALLFTATGPCT
jgi:hypothetical protein